MVASLLLHHTSRVILAWCEAYADLLTGLGCVAKMLIPVVWVRVGRSGWVEIAVHMRGSVWPAEIYQVSSRGEYRGRGLLEFILAKPLECGDDVCPSVDFGMSLGVALI